MSELEDAVELMKNYILATPEHEKALNLLIEVAESPQKYCPFSFNCIPAVWKKKIKETLLSFLQKVGSWGGLIVQLDKILTDIRREETGVAVNGNPHEELTAFIEKVLEEK